MKFSSPKGVFDVLPYREKEPWQRSHLWQHLESEIRSLANIYNFSEVRTPIFEKAEIFHVGVGESSDIISKEMYTFQDKKQRLLALRPEGTSAVLRAFFEKHLLNERPIHKLFYIAPMFRYDKPQSGRYRQHHQFGVEVLGASSYETDVEVIDLLMSLYERLGIKNLLVQLNCLGDAECREAFKQALKEFLAPNLAALSQDSQIRFQQNPLRILDSKDPSDQQLLKNAPNILEFLSPTANEHFKNVQETLTQLGIAYQVDPTIVRGLDYYNGLVFEITSSSLGAQNSIGGGGRYDGFAKLFGKVDLPGIGFGTGMERILQTILQQQLPLPKAGSPFLFFAPMDPPAKRKAFLLAKQLRSQNIPTEIDLSNKKIQDKLRRASGLGVSYTAIIGQNEVTNNIVTCKNMEQRIEETIPMTEFVASISKKWSCQ